MSTPILYNHPSLVLGNIADTEVMGLLERITELQSSTDAAQEKLNSLIQMKRSMTMTVNELKSMNINMSAVDEKLKEIDQNINQEANNYMTVFLKNENDIQTVKSELASLKSKSQTVESPIDVTVSQLKAKPFFSDSLRLDSQYFSAGGVREDEVVGNLEKFVKNAAGKGADELAKTASQQVVNQYRNQRLCGTLVIVANCTHRNVGMFDPLKLDPQKAIRTWNAVYPKNRIEIDEQMTDDSPKDDNSSHLTLITGAAYGSSFVGMIHILQTEKGQAVDFEAMKTEVEEKIRMAGWLSHVSGKLGIDAQYLDEIKSMLTTKTISTHISVITMGLISPIKSRDFLSTTAKVVNLPDNTPKEPQNPSHSIASASNATVSKLQATEMHSKKVADMVKVMSQVDIEQNNTFNINSLMTALDNYINKVSDAKSDEIMGVPISFFTQQFSRGDIVRLWSEKYLSDIKEEARSNAKLAAEIKEGLGSK